MGETEHADVGDFYALTTDERWDILFNELGETAVKNDLKRGFRTHADLQDSALLAAATKLWPTADVTEIVKGLFG